MITGTCLLLDSGGRSGPLKALIKHESTPMITGTCLLLDSGGRSGPLKAPIDEDGYQRR
jgi:hypothetical protein